MVKKQTLICAELIPILVGWLMQVEDEDEWYSVESVD